MPVPYPLKHYKHGLSIQPAMGSLVAGIIRDPKNTIHPVLDDFKQHDKFMERLLQVSDKFNEAEKVQDIHMCILRSDYMVDIPTDTLKLVEYNTIASSFGPLSQKVGELQNYISKKYLGKPNYQKSDLTQVHEMHNDGKSYIDRHVLTFKQAVDLYKTAVPESSEDLYVLYVVDASERNVVD